MGEEDAKKMISRFKSLYNLPTTDLVRFGNAKLVSSIGDIL